MSLVVARPFRASVRALRRRVAEDPLEVALFDVLCAAGDLAYRFPETDINLRDVTGPRDPRPRLSRRVPAPWGMGARARPRAWAAAGDRLASRIAASLAARAGGASWPMRVLLSYAPAGLAPDCAVPTDPVLRAAYAAVVSLFARAYPTEAHVLRRLPMVDRARLERLRAEAAQCVDVGRTASGRRPGPEGRDLAVDRSLLRLVEQTMHRDLSLSYYAKYLIYAAPGDHIWPHADDPRYPVTLLLCLDRALPRGRGRASAFLGYRPDGTVERHDFAPGSALVFDAGLVHAREPIRPGGRVVLLSLLYARPEAGT